MNHPAHPKIKLKNLDFSLEVPDNSSWEAQCSRLVEGNYLKVREVIQRLEAEGWELVAVKGDHRQYKHPKKPGKVTVSAQFGTDIPKGALGNIRRQARW